MGTAYAAEFDWAADRVEGKYYEALVTAGGRRPEFMGRAGITVEMMRCLMARDRPGRRSACPRGGA